MELSGNVRIILDDKQAQVWTVAPEKTVFEAIQMMAEKNVGALPVVENGRLVGIITERDYTRKVILKGKSSRETPVRDIMTADPLVAAPLDPIVECMRTMTQNRVRHLPVMDGQQMAGIVSIGDLLSWTISTQTATIGQLEKYITGEYPA